MREDEKRCEERGRIRKRGDREESKIKGKKRGQKRTRAVGERGR